MEGLVSSSTQRQLSTCFRIWRSFSVRRGLLMRFYSLHPNKQSKAALTWFSLRPIQWEKKKFFFKLVFLDEDLVWSVCLSSMDIIRYGFLSNPFGFKNIFVFSFYYLVFAAISQVINGFFLCSWLLVDVFCIEMWLILILSNKSKIINFYYFNLIIP